MGPAQAASRAQEPALEAPAAPPQTVTSHSLTLSTKAFSLDFTWSRVETDPPAKRSALTGPAADPPAIARQAVRYDRRARTITAPLDQPAPAAPAPAAAPRQSFAEVLRRRQLAGLVLIPSRPPADRQMLFTPTATADPLPGPVCRAYAEALGPLGGETSRFYTA